jgi:hypothetical protein
MPTVMASGQEHKQVKVSIGRCEEKDMNYMMVRFSEKTCTGQGQCKEKQERSRSRKRCEVRISTGRLQLHVFQLRHLFFFF